MIYKLCVNIIDILMKYKDRLVEIQFAYESGIFDSKEFLQQEYPYDMITDYRNTEAYDQYNIEDLGMNLYSDMRSLDFITYKNNDIFHLQDKVFDENDDLSTLTLEDFYALLIYLFDDYDSIRIENEILCGSLLKIIIKLSERLHEL